MSENWQSSEIVIHSRAKTHNHSLNRDFAQEWLAVFVVQRRKEDEKQ